MFVKICGITNTEDALLAAGLGADAVGMIFAASSRRITSGEARDIVRRLPPEIIPVGVFRNEQAKRVAQIANSLGLRAVQLHGRESAEETRWLAERIPMVIKAFGATDKALLRHGDYGAHRLLIDSATPSSGQVFDWAVLEEAPLNKPFILAGGLNPDNVVAAVAAVQPWGVDVSTGVEASVGRKDPVKLRQFMAAARSVPVERREADWDVADRPFNWEEDARWR